nr:MAG TPA: Reovirus sigma C capsid protein [Caudoviricetes sp.]
MTSKDVEEIYKAINKVSNKVNDVSAKLDEYIHRLDEATNNRVTIAADGLDSLAETVAQNQEAITALQDIVHATLKEN